jgi:hypothetical protein
MGRHSFCGFLTTLSAASTIPVQQFEVKAKENSLTGGTALNTGITVAKGDKLMIKVAEDDTWSG